MQSEGASLVVLERGGAYSPVCNPPLPGAVWSTVANWNQWADKWKKGSFLDLDPEFIESSVKQSLKLLGKVGKVFSGREDDCAGCADIASTVVAQLKEFEPLLPLITVRAGLPVTPCLV